jgi:cyclophilin family peptidyl-prolyl cis-trans isomerase
MLPWKFNNCRSTTFCSLVVGTLAVSLAVCLLACEPARAQDVPVEDSQVPAAEAEPAQQRYEQLLVEWKERLKQLRAIQTEYHETPAEEAQAVRERWTATVDEIQQLIPELREAAKEAYLAAPNEDRQLTRFLAQLVQDAASRDDYEVAAELSRLLIDNEAGIREIYNFAGISHFAQHQFDRAEQYLKQADAAGTLDDRSKGLFGIINEYRSLWEEEQSLREQERQKDDLPRVRLETTKGDIILELFEDQAPETVGNFVSLVEKNFYDGVTFHRVLPGFMAQTGDPAGDGSGGPGYRIYSEAQVDGARKHFRGSLSMANTGQPNSGGSQFFITFLPTPQLNGGHTVFGRVIEGFDVLSELQRRDPQESPPLPEPDRILEAEVLRKRDHAYVPNKVQ